MQPKWPGRASVAAGSMPRPSSVTEDIVLATQFKADRRRRRVLQGIRHRLLGDHAQVMHHGRRQWRHWAIDPHLQRRHAVARQATDDFFQLGGQVEAVGATGPQVGDQVARF